MREGGHANENKTKKLHASHERPLMLPAADASSHAATHRRHGLETAAASLEPQVRRRPPWPPKRTQQPRCLVNVELRCDHDLAAFFLLKSAISSEITAS